SRPAPSPGSPAPAPPPSPSRPAARPARAPACPSSARAIHPAPPAPAVAGASSTGGSASSAGLRAPTSLLLRPLAAARVDLGDRHLRRRGGRRGPLRLPPPPCLVV